MSYEGQQADQIEALKAALDASKTECAKAIDRAGSALLKLHGVTRERDAAIDRAGRIGAELAEVKARCDAALAACRAALAWFENDRGDVSDAAMVIEAISEARTGLIPQLRAVASGAPDPLRARVEELMKKFMAYAADCAVLGRNDKTPYDRGDHFGKATAYDDAAALLRAALGGAE